jgi:glycosyltransferase involved in cell wall biosynthesis
VGFRVGIWCDYGFTLLPDEGIGVLVYNLVQGLLRIEEPVEVVLLVSAGDQSRVASFTGNHEHLRILSRQDRMPRWWRVVHRFLNNWSRASDRIHHGTNRIYEILERWRKNVKDWLANRQGRSPRAIAVPAIIALVLAAPALALAFWITYAIYKYAGATIQIITLPLRKLDQGLSTLNQALLSKEPSNWETARQVNCDAWIVPQVLLNEPLPHPSVVMIHDFASSHFQEEFEKWYPGYHERAAHLIPLRAREAAVCACMSNFIRDSDLLGVLKLPPSKVRVVRTAPPADLPQTDDSSTPSFLRRSYVFFPTAFRPYKNHAGLIQAFRLLRDRYLEDSWDLVFTGEKAGYLPPELRKQVEECGLEGRVHVLGRVDRRMLAALFRQAFATIVPSYYEQGSFQIYEALQAGCPVACSRIPPFLEQCGPMGDSMLYFDPADPEAIGRTILEIRDNREEIRRRQRQESRVLWNRTWDHVARDFLQVCKEMTQMNLRWSA